MTDKQIRDRVANVESDIHEQIQFYDQEGSHSNGPVLAQLRPFLVELARRAANAERQACAVIAGSMTGPGNTPGQAQGYSDACRDILSAIIARGGKAP